MKYCERPFSTVEEMDYTILERFHEKIDSRDHLYVLGDFAFGSYSTVYKYVRRLPTKNVFLILGNHDRLSVNQYKSAGFSWAKTYYELNVPLDIGGKKIPLFHYPMESWNGSFRGSWHLHSHTHNSMPDNPNKLRMNVGVDVTDFYPVNVSDVENFMAKKTPIFDC